MIFEKLVFAIFSRILRIPIEHKDSSLANSLIYILALYDQLKFVIFLAYRKNEFFINLKMFNPGKYIIS